MQPGSSPGKPWAGIALALCALALARPGAAGGHEPLWEIGLGIGSATFPEYRGSNERSDFTVPIPYLVYRGDRLRVGREGARGLLARWRDWELDFSVDAAVPVDSSDEGPRAGMAELDPIVEAGPSLVRRLGASDLGRGSCRLPLRAAVAVSTDLDSTAHEGWTLQPSLGLDAPDLLGDWDFRFSLGPRFASRDYHAYYYDVGPGDVRPGRDGFRADAGYSGLGFSVSAAQRFDHTWIGAFLRYDNLSGAAFADSPLVETEHALSAGLGISWVLGESARRVPPPE